MAGRQPPARRIVSLTTEAGERFDVEERRRPAQTYGESFVIGFDAPMLALAYQTTSAATFRVWFVLTYGRRLDWTEWREVSQRELADELALRQASISRALAELGELALIERRGRGCRVRWRLTTRGAFRGNVASFQAARRARQEEALEAETAAAVDEICSVEDLAGASPEPASGSSAEAAAAASSDPRPATSQRTLRLLGNLPGPEAA